MKPGDSVSKVIGHTALSLLAMTGCPAAAGEFGVVVQAASDWVYHGNSETLGEPVVGINAEWQSSAHFFVGVEAHRARVPGDQHREGSVMLYVGTGRPFGDGWYGTISALQREYPGSAKEWDFAELDIELSHRSGWLFELDYSPDYYEHDTAAVHASVGFTGRIDDRRYWSARGGTVELSDDDVIDHQYFRVGAGISRGSLNIDLSYGWNNGDQDSRFGKESVTSPGLVLQIAYRVQ